MTFRLIVEVDIFSGLLSSLFDIDNVKSAFGSVFKKRSNNARSIMLLLGKLENAWNSDDLHYFIGACFLIEMFLITGKGNKKL